MRSDCISKKEVVRNVAQEGTFLTQDLLSVQNLLSVLPKTREHGKKNGTEVDRLSLCDFFFFLSDFLFIQYRAAIRRIVPPSRGELETLVENCDFRATAFPAAVVVPAALYRHITLTAPVRPRMRTPHGHCRLHSVNSTVHALRRDSSGSTGRRLH